ncbi:MAG: DJ-1 family glyoxalase III [Planctomycetota bacterium]
MNRKVLIPIADGSEEIEAVCLIDVLRRAGADVTVASVTGRRQITASRGVKIVADVTIDKCVSIEYDLIALPGGMPGAENLRDSLELKQMLQQQSQQGRLFGAICASPVVVLAAQGLLDRFRATSYPAFADQLPNPATDGEPVVVDSNCITSKGPATALAFALKLVELLFGHQKADEISRAMLIHT